MPGPVASLEPVREFASFRDPSGHVFRRDGTIYRSVHSSYAPHFLLAETSGLFHKAVALGHLLPFEKCGAAARPMDAGTLCVLKPLQLEMLSYPYEWCFSQLQDAAIVTLEIQLLALQHGMILKDATAFNIQFVDGRPCLIDHLSFEALSEHRAWPAYGQFCRHFLAPLLLMSHVDLSLGRLLQLHIDGIPLPLASTLLPWRTRLHLRTLIHLHAHARMERKYADTRAAGKNAVAGQVSAAGQQAIANSLLALVKRLRPRQQRTEWGDYYTQLNYSRDAFEQKKARVVELVRRAAPRVIWDVGGNNGEFSRALKDVATSIVCMDIDPVAVEQNYRACKSQKIGHILPLILDLTNPSPGVGFANLERPALLARKHPDLIVALALIHHLSIGNNLPFSYSARFFAGLTNTLLIEFVPKSDSQVQRLLRGRKDIFPHYDRTSFETCFAAYFDIVEMHKLADSDRTIFLMHKRNEASTSQ